MVVSLLISCVSVTRLYYVKQTKFYMNSWLIMRGILVLILWGFCLGAEDTGNPAGLMAECPGMNRSTTFSPGTLRSLYVVVLHPHSRHGEAKCRLSAGGASCAAKHINLKKRITHVMISGYMDASFSPLVRSMSSLYLARGQNVIIVEIFPVLVRTYPVAARITRPLGHLLGEFMAALTEKGLSPNMLTISGGSLGAYIAYNGAVKYRQLTGKKPARLTALDPAGPCFRNLPPEERMTPEAAENVDIVHTNIDGFGIPHSMGHVDFYVNGGEFQSAIISNFILPCFQLCSHVRAAIYWMLSFTHPEQFLAVRCHSVADARKGNCYDDIPTTNVLGPNTNFSRPGIYYLPTAANLPYFLGKDGLQKIKYGMNNYLLKSAPDEDMVI